MEKVNKAELIQSEHDEQVILFEWAKLQESKYPELSVMYAIPNGGRRNIVTGARLKAEGVLAGAPDICLPCKSADGRYNALYIELKRVGGIISANQKRVIAELNRYGNRAVTAYGFEEARDIIIDYLRVKS